MNLKENIREGLRSIKSNSLRTILTAAIIALGITALVGILTTIDGMQNSVDSSFAGLGANSFDIKVENERGRRRGLNERVLAPIRFVEAMKFKELFSNKNKGATISISTNVTGIGELKYRSLKTNPNTSVRGIDDSFIEIKGYKLLNGRNFNENELTFSSNVTILGSEVAHKLFPKESPVNKQISLMGESYKVIGVLDKKGSITGGDDDRVALVPLESGRQLGANQQLFYDITASVPNVSNMDYIIGEATAIMRLVRRDRLGEDDSFSIERSDALAKDFEEVTGYLRIGGFGISFITLLGASIALMNIMMVSVTERTREIGIRKALGATPFKIRLQFLLEAIVICILGGISGIILGIGAGNLITIATSENANFIIPWAWILLGLFVCVVVGISSGIYPAYKASKLDPIESLRYE